MLVLEPKLCYYNQTERMFLYFGEKVMGVRAGLISLLMENKGNTLSGEELAEQLGCTRAAVWKAVNQLRSEGYEISAGRNKGYTLAESSDFLSEEEISRYLDSKYRPIVYQEISSTNDVLKRLAADEAAPEGTVIISDYQTGGKGRLGRSFFSPKGSGLYMSLLLRPRGSVGDNLILTAQSAVAVLRAVKRSSGIELGIKWVNDLYLEERKVCGILSEGQANFESGSLDFVVVGIGINIYEPEEGFPQEISERAGSLLGKKSGGGYINRNILAAEIIKEFYSLSKEASLSHEYMERNIVPGHKIKVLDRGNEREAYAESILPDGRLEIREMDGSLTALVYGEISVRIVKDYL